MLWGWNQCEMRLWEQPLSTKNKNSWSLSKGYSCQCITHFGCLWSENREKTFKFVITFHQQATDRLPTSYRHITNCRPTVGGLSADCRPTGSLYFGQNLLAVCRPTVGQQSADCWSTHGRQSANSRPTVGQQTADSWPTGFLGRSSSQLPIYWYSPSSWIRIT